MTVKKMQISEKNGIVPSLGSKTTLLIGSKTTLLIGSKTALLIGSKTTLLIGSKLHS